MENKELKEKESMDTLELARECGGRLESWMTNPPKPAMWHFTPAALSEFESRIRADEREKAAKKCDEIETQHWNDFKGRYIGPHPRPQTRGNPYTDGQASGASDCASAIRGIA